MNKEQIEEMAKIYCKTEFLCNKGCQTEGCRIYEICDTLYNAEYRKVPDGAVILTPEERDEEMKEINKTLAERDELKAENERLKEVIADQNELCWNCKKSIKEFAEKLRKKVISLNVWEFGEIEIIDVDDIDELLKEYIDER